MESEGSKKMLDVTNIIFQFDNFNEDNVAFELKTNEDYFQQKENFEKDEDVSERIEEIHNIEINGVKRNIELITETENRDLNIEKGKLELPNEKKVDTDLKDGAEFNVVKRDAQLIKKIDDAELTNKSEEFTKEKEEEFTNEEKVNLTNGQKEEVITNENEMELTNGNKEEGITNGTEVEHTNEKGHSRLKFDKDCNDYKKREVFKENCTTDDNLLNLDDTETKVLANIRSTECEKKKNVICSECGSDSKISTSSTGKGSSSYSGSKSGTSIKDQNSKESFKIPSDALVTKIVRQAEFYFSDFNILKNNFLLKHVRRNKEGYVSLKLVASFRKIKSMTKDWRVVAHSLESSTILELNSEKTKIRRIEPIPKIEETSLGKTVIVFNLPFQNPNSEELKEMFSKFGNIVHAEIMSPKSEKYNTYHKRCRYHNQEIASSVFGSVEFENYDDAVSAIKDEESHLPKENQMKVVTLVSQIQRTRRRKSRFNQYKQYSRWGNGRFNSWYEFQNDQMINGIPFDDYRYPRPLFNEKQYRRSYRGGYPKAIHSSSSSGEIPKLRDYYVASGADVRSSYTRNRQLKLSNRMNINRQYSTHQPKYVDENFGYRETNFET